MGKLSAEKQAALDAWATAAAKGTDAKAEIDPSTGVVTKPSQTEAMMATLQGELTESALDAAMKKANPKAVGDEAVIK
jgi:hypothetical protein